MRDSQKSRRRQHRPLLTGRGPGRAILILALVAAFAQVAWIVSPSPAQEAATCDQVPQRPPSPDTSAPANRDPRPPAIDTGQNVDNGANAHTPMGSASVVKVLIADELLYRDAQGEIELGPAELAQMETMIMDSNDSAASSLYSKFDGVSLIAAALTRHQLTESGPPVNPLYWGDTMVTAHDIATLYNNILEGSSISPADRDYLVSLMGPAHPAAEVGGQGMRALAHSRSRRRVAVLSAGLAVLVIGVGIPTGLSLIEPADNSVAAPPSPESIPSADIYGSPTRGSLADDAEFVEAVRQLPWTVDGYPLQTEPPVESRRVVFVGDVPQARWALVIGEATVLTQATEQAPESVSTESTPTSPPTPSGEAVTGLWGTWFVGVAGADPAQMRLVKDFPISPDLPASMFNPTTGTFVVVAAPGDLIEVSSRPEVAADGTVSRNYVDAGSSDGVAATRMQPATFSYSSTTVQYRVSRAGVVVVDELGPSMVDDSNSPVSPEVEVDYLRQPVSDDVRQQRPDIQSRSSGMLSDYGLRPDEATVQLQYYGPIFSLTTGSMSISVMTMTFPSGAVLTRVTDLAPDLMQEAQCLIDNISPAGAPPARGNMAIRCDVQSSAESSLIIIAPTDYAGGYAVAEGSAGPVRVELDREGVGMIAFPDGATSVTIFAADGTMVDEVPIFTT